KVRRRSTGLDCGAVEIARHGEEALGPEEPAGGDPRHPRRTQCLRKSASHHLDGAGMIDRPISLAATGLVIAANAAMPSRSVDFPVPFSPTITVMARPKARENSPRRNGTQKGYAVGSVTRSPSSQRRLR